MELLYEMEPPAESVFLELWITANEEKQIVFVSKLLVSLRKEQISASDAELHDRVVFLTNMLAEMDANLLTPITDACSLSVQSLLLPISDMPSLFSTPHYAPVTHLQVYRLVPHDEGSILAMERRHAGAYIDLKSHLFAYGGLLELFELIDIPGVCSTLAPFAQVCGYVFFCP